MTSLRERLADAGQDQLADALEHLDGERRARLAAQIEQIDLAGVGRLFRELTGHTADAFADLEPPEVHRAPAGRGRPGS